VRTWLAAAVTILFWGSSFAGIRAGLRAFAPAHLVLLRFTLASIVLGIYALIVRMRLPAVRDLAGIGGIGLAGVVFYQLALNYGELTVSAGAASLIIASGPVFTALFASLFLGERLSGLGWLGIALSFAGVGLIALGEAQGFRLNTGAILVLAAAVSTALHNVVQKPYLRRYSALQVTSCSIWIATLVLLIFVPGLPHAVTTAPLEAKLAVVYLGVFPAAISYATWSYVLSRLPASRAGSLLYGVPPIAILFGWIWLGEVSPPLSLIGGGLCLAGIILVNKLGRREVRAR
jgi:drug/metabolite transporter (DMT)-like permease